MQFKVFVSVIAVVTCYELKQVLILSRHTIRTPLIENFYKYSPCPWPKWNKRAAFATEKGKFIEEYMGEYFYKWLVSEKLFKNSCPDENSVHIYANTFQRTRESAKAFVRGAFKNCNISVASMNSKGMDPIFNIVVRNDSKAVKEPIVKEMENKLKYMDLGKSFLELEDLLDMSNSEKCKMERQCHLINADNKINFKIGQMPNIIGSLSLAHVIVDSFLMSYYEGHAIEDFACGKIRDSKKWMTLTRIIKENDNILFNNTSMGRQLGRPLLGYISSVFNKEKPIKFTLLNGHDGNLYTVLTALGVKDFSLPEEYDIIPIGAKLVFQKLYDNIQKKYLLKLDFVYLTSNQLRDGAKISKNNPPRWLHLFLNDCPIDSKEFCPWDEFIKILKTASGA